MTWLVIVRPGYLRSFGDTARCRIEIHKAKSNRHVCKATKHSLAAQNGAPLDQLCSSCGPIQSSVPTLTRDLCGNVYLPEQITYVPFSDIYPSRCLHTRKCIEMMHTETSSRSSAFRSGAIRRGALFFPDRTRIPFHLLADTRLRCTVPALGRKHTRPLARARWDGPCGRSINRKRANDRFLHLSTLRTVSPASALPCQPHWQSMIWLPAVHVLHDPAGMTLSNLRKHM